jgi:hypothetical protein
MGRRRMPGNFTTQKANNSIEDLVGNEGNEYPHSDPTQNDANYDQ